MLATCQKSWLAIGGGNRYGPKAPKAVVEEIAERRANSTRNALVQSGMDSERQLMRCAPPSNTLGGAFQVKRSGVCCSALQPRGRLQLPSAKLLCMTRDRSQGSGRTGHCLDDADE
mmetsp:Transcript_41516/g.96212  ORF Transcript_41516/g.96212 Transcript_41516/m.96212 type:complete len:116 (+) Transcript_41516:1691-2038(+)